jgi:hypothetical protein
MEFINQSCVVVEGQMEDKCLIAFYSQTDESDRQEEISNYLSNKLPSFMIPNMLFRIPTLPLTSSGKIDKKALPTLDELLAKDNHNQIIAPQGAIENEVHSIFCQVLKLSQLSTYANFFEMGGNSLRAVQIMSRINSKFNSALSVPVLFVHPTIKKMTKQIQLALQTSDKQIKQLVRVKNLEKIPLSSAQQRLWFLHHFYEQKDASYNIPLAYIIHGALHLRTLELAIQEVIKRHSILRTIFLQEAGKPYQVILPEVPFTLNVEVIEEHNIDKTTHQHAHQTFNLEKTPPLCG